MHSLDAGDLSKTTLTQQTITFLYRNSISVLPLQLLEIIDESLAPVSDAARNKNLRGLAALREKRSPPARLPSALALNDLAR